MTALAAERIEVSDDDQLLLADVSVAIEPGETLLLCGAPGSGKTLLAKALAGLLDDREDLQVCGTVERTGDVGFVFQYPARQLVRRTVRLDLGFGLENRGVAPEEITARVSRIASRFGVTDLLDRRVDRLSAGETATVALLGVLVTDPDVVVLDEPFSTLDHPGARQLLDAVDRLRSDGTPVVIAEHDARDLLTRADRVLCLEEGEVVATGSPAAVVSTLETTGVKLPFQTRIAIARGGTDEGPIPLAADGTEDGRP